MIDSDEEISEEDLLEFFDEENFEEPDLSDFIDYEIPNE
jgi:hypothetical protein